MRILGIDPALTVTGYGVIECAKNKFSLLEAGIIKTSSTQSVERRLNKIYQSVSELIADTRCEIMVLEKLYAHYRHPVTAFLLGQARGVICLACAQNHIPLVEYSATRVKKAVVGKGLASKSQVQRMVADLLGLKCMPKYLDVTDALALAITHSYILRAKI
ncbi:MAG: crossover junction endodeoxyribonuclease RuvC [Deltaproteobacteria bacterium]